MGSPGFVKMNPITFDESGPAGTDSGWKTTYTSDSSDGVQRPELLPERARQSIKLKPRVLTKTNAPENSQPDNVDRQEKNIQQETSWNTPLKKAPVLFQHPSDSAKDYYFAPGEAEASPPLRATSLPLDLPLDFVKESPTNYGDSDLNLEVGSDGYAKFERDSNFSQDPRTWRFRKKDKSVGLTDRGEDPLDLRDVGIGELAYPLNGGLRPVFFPVFGATPRQRKQKKKINRDKSKRRKEEKAAPKPEPKAEEPTKATADPMEEPEGFVEQKSTPSQRNEALKELDESEARTAFLEGPEGHASVKQDRAKGDLAEIEKNLSDAEKKKLAALPEKEQEQDLINRWFRQSEERKVTKSKAPTDDLSTRYKGNVLQDPALDGLDMEPQEKLFTTIRKWEGDGYVLGGDKLDSGTKSVLAEKPVGAGRYFEWQYVTPEQSKEGAAEDVEKEGYTVRSGEGVLRVTRLDGWKQAEADVMKKRRPRPA